MKIPGNNPAGRLYFILQDASSRIKSDVTWRIWTEVFGIERDQRLEVVACLGKLSGLAVEARDLARHIAAEEATDSKIDESFFRCFNSVTNLLVKQDLDAQWEKNLTLLHESTLLGLAAR